MFFVSHSEKFSFDDKHKQTTMQDISYGSYKNGEKIWKYFERSLAPRDGEYGKCIVEGENGTCNKVLSMGKNKSTGTLQNHLSGVHKINWKSPHNDSNDDPVPRKKVKDSLETVLSRIIALDGVSFRVLANSTDIRHLFSLGGYTIPSSANTIREMVLRFAAGIRMDMTKEFASLKAAGHLVSLTLDEWTSMRGRRYANINAHWNGKTFCLGLVRCEGSMVAERCRDLVRAVLSTYGLVEADVIGITTDAAKVMVKMGRQLPFTHQLCIAHGLHLAVMDVIYARENISLIPSGELDDHDGQEEDVLDGEDEVGVVEEDEPEDGDFQVVGIELGNELPLNEEYQLKSLISKVRDVVSLFHQSPVKRDALDRHTLADHGRTLGPIGDCKTRWSSTFSMVERFLKIRVSLVKALADVGSNIHFDDCEVRSLGVIADGLKEVQETLTVLCGRSATLLTMDAALTCLLNSIDKSYPFGAALHKALVTRINKRRTIASNVMQYLHNRGSNQIHPEMKTNTRAQMEKYLLDLWTRTNPGQADEEEIVTIDEHVELNFSQRLRRAILEQCAEPEVANNAGGAAQDLKGELMNFRRTHIRGPKLERSYLYLKTVQVTSVEAERSFSIGGRFCTKLRSRLGDECLSALTMLHFYFKTNAI